MSLTASLLRVKLVALAVTVTLPGRNPLWLLATNLHGKPWVNCGVACDHGGDCQIMTLSYLEHKANTWSAITVKLATSVAKQCFYPGKLSDVRTARFDSQK